MSEELARKPGWYVVYRVPAFDDREHWAGPYTFDVMGFERDDICGYEGVVFERYEVVR